MTKFPVFKTMRSKVIALVLFSLAFTLISGCAGKDIQKDQFGNDLPEAASVVAYSFINGNNVYILESYSRKFLVIEGSNGKLTMEQIQ